MTRLPAASALSPPLRLRRRTRPPRSPLLSDIANVSVAASLRVGLLHHLRGAPSQDRNAILHSPSRSSAMLSVFAGHGKHGARLAELAATVVSRHVRRCLYPTRNNDGNIVDGKAESTSSGSSFGSLVSAPSGEGDLALPLEEIARESCVFKPSLERVVDDAFVEANIAVDATIWARNSGATATVCLLRKGTLVVGTVGNACVMVASRRAGSLTIHLLSEPHDLGFDDERERVERFGGVVSGESVSDLDDTLTLPFTRTLGDLEMRKAGICQIPTIRTHDLTARDTHIIVSSQPLWKGEATTAPDRLAEVIAKGKDDGMVELAEQLMKVAFGATGPTYDATILCARLR